MPSRPDGHARSVLFALACAVALAGCGDDNSGEPSAGSGTVMGTVMAPDGTRMAGAVVTVWLNRTTGSTFGYQSDTTDNSGKFSVRYPADSLDDSTSVWVSAAGPWGSGIQRWQSVWDSALSVSPGVSDTVNYAISLVQEEPPVSNHPLPLSGSQLLGTYDGASVAPTDVIEVTVYLTLQVTTAGTTVEGRYAFDYSAPITCLRGGEGSFTGSVVNDTLHLMLVGDTLWGGGSPGPRTVTAINAYSESSSADTLIVMPGGDPAGCYSEPGPIRMIRGH